MVRRFVRDRIIRRIADDSAAQNFAVRLIDAFGGVSQRRDQTAPSVGGVSTGRVDGG